MIPKEYINNLRLRRNSIGKERRLNMSKLILEKGTPFPKPIEYSDIDKEFERWINDLGMTYEGKKLPIFKLFANQRIGEYSQSWEHLDEVGNLLLNFIAITRENNPKHGNQQGSSYNIPGNRNYSMFYVPVLEENGEEVYERYTMKQPFAIDFIYKVTLITNKYELLNKMNQTILNEFKALECYIAPHGHYMSMELSDVSDESEYSLDDRKYYAQTYNITLKGYIIRREDFEVTKVPSRVMANIMGEKHIKKTTTVEVEEEFDNSCWCNNRQQEPNQFENKKINLTINFPICEFKTEFEIDTDLFIESIETENIYDFVMKINNEYVSFDNEINIYNGDTIYIEIERDDKLKDTSITLVGHSKEMVDVLTEHEITLDEPIYGEEIIKNV